jgi:thiosulfate/3-mercaptopyruvate sulfurtransferase
MRSYREIESVWRDGGITSDRRVIFYCGTGWRASEAFFCAYLMGWPDISIYDGGWLEWSLDESRRIEVGIPV